MESARTNDFIWHILLVDDDEDDYLLTRDMLSSVRRGKFRIDWSANYDEARAALLKNNYDAALVDYDMGARSGIQLIQEVIGSGCATPIILFTGRGTYEIDVEAMQAGAVDYLSKGETNPALLERAIRYAIERKRHENELAAANEALSAANAQLAAGRQELAEILGSIRDGFFSLDREWNFVYINAIAAQRGNREPSDYIGKNIWEAQPELVGSELWERYHEVMETRQPAHFEFQGSMSQQFIYEVRVYPSANGISVYWIDITEQKAFENTLYRERELLQKIFDNIPVMINLYPPGSPTPQINPFFTEITGWTSEDIAAADLMQLCYPDPVYRAEVRHFIESYAPGWHDCSVTTRSGETLETSWTNMRLSDGTHIGIGIDIRERKRAEQVLRAQQQWMEERIQQIEGLFENAPAGVAIFEPGAPYRIITCNRQFQRYLPEFFWEKSLAGIELSDLFDEAQDARLMEIFDEVLHTGITRVMDETPYDRPVQGRTWWNWSLAPVRAGDRITGLAMLVVDVTKEVLARSVLEQERAFLNSVIEQLPSAVMIFEAGEKRVVLANQQVEKTLRIDRPRKKSAAGYEDLSQFFFRDRGVENHKWPFIRALNEGTSVREEEMPIQRGDGTQGLYSVSASPIFDAQGQITAAVAVFEDITERKRAERDTAFLIALGELLNQQPGPETVLQTVSRQVAAHLGARRCLFLEIDLECSNVSFFTDSIEEGSGPGVPFPIDQLPVDLQADHPAGMIVINRDAKNDPRTANHYRRGGWLAEMRSYVSVPLMRGGRWVATLLTGDTRPRKWNDRQVAFLQTVAERTWATYETHRLMRALQENQERYRQLAEEAQFNLRKTEFIIDSMSEAVFISDLTGRFTRANRAALALFGFTREEETLREMNEIFRLIEAWTPDGQPVPDDGRPVARAARGETVLNFEMRGRRRDTGKEWIGLYSSIPVRDENGETLFILSTITDITRNREDEAQRSEMRATLQTQHLLVAQREEERVQIARDIHDGPLQDLILLSYSLQTVLQDQPEPAERQALEALYARSQKLVSDLRGVCNQLRPPLLARFGLAKAIRAHAEELQAQEISTAIHLDLDEDQEMLPVDIRLALYRIYQESIRNILRHAGASRCTVRLRLKPDVIGLEIVDNGAGFDLPGDWLTLAREGHLGLVGIKERAEAIGGRLELTSRPGQGTRVYIRLPRSG